MRTISAAWDEASRQVERRWFGVDLSRPSPVVIEVLPCEPRPIDAEHHGLIEDIKSGEAGMRIKCPHCGEAALIRTSKQLNKILREGYCQCLNVACGHTFKINVEVVMTISPSAVPDPEIAAQLKQWVDPARKRDAKQHFLDHRSDSASATAV